MTERTASRPAGRMPVRVAAGIARLWRRRSGRLHADGDAFACEHGWITTRTTGRLGLGTRSCWNTRFGQRTVATRRSLEYTGWRTDARSG